MGRIARFVFGEPARDFEGCDDARRFRDAHARSFGELFGIALRQRGKAFAQQVAGELDGVLPGDSGAQQGGQEFGVGKAFCSVREHPLAGTLIHRHVGDEFVHAKSLGGATRIRVKLYEREINGCRAHKRLCNSIREVEAIHHRDVSVVKSF